LEKVYGWTHTEIAEGCQLPLGTVKARMRLGLLQLKRALEQMGSVVRSKTQQGSIAAPLLFPLGRVHMLSY